jgi:hypothetical protein
VDLGDLLVVDGLEQGRAGRITMLGWPGAAGPARMRPGRRGWVAGIRSSWMVGMHARGGRAPQGGCACGRAGIAGWPLLVDMSTGPELRG